MALEKLDRIPGDYNIYIGGILPGRRPYADSVRLFTLRRKEALKAANVTHVVSVLRMQLDDDLFSPYKHLQIEVDDVDDENLLEHFATTNAFIQSALDGGGGVLVHCAMGKSRSAAVCIAYLLSRSRDASGQIALTPASAVSLIRECRPLVEPNDGFMQQLEIYHAMGCPDAIDGRDNLDDHPMYQRWIYQKQVEESVACGRAPELSEVRFEDEVTNSTTSDPASSGKNVEVKCRKCRRTVATSSFIIPHLPKNTSTAPGQPCAHVFLHPLSWMRPALEPGTLDGRLTCPNLRCASNLGKFAWQGQRCSCGEWVVPGFSLQRGKVDEVPLGGNVTSLRQPVKDGGGFGGMRMPPKAGEAEEATGVNNSDSGVQRPSIEQRNKVHL